MQLRKAVLVRDESNIVLDRGFFNRRDISLEAKGMASWIAALPEKFHFKENYFYAHVDENGKEVSRMKAVRTAIKELISKKFLFRVRVKPKAGFYAGGTFWYFDIAGISPSKLATELCAFCGHEMAIQILNAEYPDYKVYVAEHDRRNPDKKVIWISTGGANVK